jgi:predicted TIM-barrel fold metal-dependent hydrolase
MAIDCHAHWIPPGLAVALRERRTAPRIQTTPDGERFITYQGNRSLDAALGDLEARCSLMRGQGVTMQVLSLAGLFGIDCLPVAESVPLVRLFNDAVGLVQRDVPEHFIGLAALPIADIPLACSELERACRLGLAGAILPVDAFRTLAAASAYRPLFELGNRWKCHFFIHPGPVVPPPEVQVASVHEDHAWQRRIVLDTQARLSEVMVTLNYSDYLDPYPNVTVQVANLGGTIPFVMERMDEVARAQRDRPPMPSQHRMRVYVDTASFGPRAIAMAAACFGADRVVLGTDCPIFDTARMLQSLARLDAGAREQIQFANAERLFGQRGEAAVTVTRRSGRYPRGS